MVNAMKAANVTDLFDENAADLSNISEEKLYVTKVSISSRVTRGRCYDHKFLRFLPIFGEKIGVFSKTNVMIKIFA
jgi:hypothetical protein